MNQRVALFDLQFLKYTKFHTPIPSTAGLIVAGYHKAQGDKVVLLDKTPKFKTYDIVYIIKDDWDLYHDTAWLRHDNIRLVGRFWDAALTTWDKEWESYPPDMTPYRNWAELWLKKYPFYKAARIDHFWYRPVLLKVGNKILNPEGDFILLIDYDLHTIDDEYEVLSTLNIKALRMLHPLDITYNTEAAFEFLKQSNVRRNLWTTFDKEIPEEEMDRLINIWNKYRLGRTIRMKIWIDDTVRGWDAEIERTLDLLSRWREEAGKRIYIEPVDQFSYKYPFLLTELRRWSGKDMGYAYNSLLDYMIYDYFQQNIHYIIDFFTQPEVIMSTRDPNSKIYKIYDLIINEPELTKLIGKPVKRKAQ